MSDLPNIEWNSREKQLLDLISRMNSNTKAQRERYRKKIERLREGLETLRDWMRAEGQSMKGTKWESLSTGFFIRADYVDDLLSGDRSPRDEGGDGTAAEPADDLSGNTGPLTGHVTERRPSPSEPTAYDPNFGDDRLCQCGHEYYRHFDSYEKMSPVGCKYCSCSRWYAPPAEPLWKWKKGKGWVKSPPKTSAPEKED